MSYIYDRRLRKIREEASKKNLGVIIVRSAPNIFYFTGFEGGGTLFIPVDRDPILLTSRLEYERAKATSYVKDIRVHALKGTPLKVDEKPVYADTTEKAICLLLEELEAKNIGIEAPTPKLEETIKKNIGIESLVDFTEVITSMRAIKDEVELEFIMKAVKVTERAMRKAIEVIDIGVSEREIAAEIARVIYSEGSPSFEPIVASGENSVYPHFTPSERKITEGDLVVIDLGARINGYCADMTRTLYIGKPRGKIREILYSVLEAQKKAIEAIAEGKPCSEVDKVARDYLKEKGLAKFFVHSLGHGVGIEIHEKPALGATSKDILKKNMVVTVEPGVYIPGVGGVRIEDMVVVTEKGCQVLTSFERELF